MSQRTSRGVGLVTTLILAAATLSACGDEAEPGPTLGGVTLGAPAAPVVARPNVLLIVLSSARADRFSAHGYERPTTPNLEALAADGVAFDACWAPAGGSGSAYASLFTGSRPDQHGLTGGERNHLTREASTLAERLGAAGYDTACISNDSCLSPDLGLTQGFREFFPMYRTADPDESTHLLAADWAVAAARRGRPFFLVVNDARAQLPFRPSAERQARFLDDADAKSTDLAEARNFDDARAMRTALGRDAVGPNCRKLLSDLYDAEISELDAAVGRLLNRLRREKLLDDTLIIVTGDHGEDLGEDAGRVGHQFSLSRSVLNVPLIVAMPGRFEGGRREPGVVRLEDVSATILETAGLERPDGLEGQPLPIGGEGIDPRLARAVWEPRRGLAAGLLRAHPDADPAILDRRIESIFDGRWHYVRTSDGTETTQSLFDVVADPDESNDVAASRADVVERLRGRMARE